MPLLGDRSWWVREAAREGLVAAGRDVTGALAPALESDDHALRSGAALVLQDVGLVDELVREDDLGKLERILDAGGERLRTAAADRARSGLCWSLDTRSKPGPPSDAETVLQACVIACAAYLALVYAMYAALMVVAFAEGRRRRREFAVDDVVALGGSRFAPGVSIVMPAYNEGDAATDAARSLLALEYPEFELLVVNDGSTDDTLARLRAAFDTGPGGGVLPRHPRDRAGRSPTTRREPSRGCS